MTLSRARAHPLATMPPRRTPAAVQCMRFQFCARIARRVTSAARATRSSRSRGRRVAASYSTRTPSIALSCMACASPALGLAALTDCVGTCAVLLLYSRARSRRLPSLLVCCMLVETLISRCRRAWLGLLLLLTCWERLKSRALSLLDASLTEPPWAADLVFSLAAGDLVEVRPPASLLLALAPLRTPFAACLLFLETLALKRLRNSHSALPA